MTDESSYYKGNLDIGIFGSITNIQTNYNTNEIDFAKDFRTQNNGPLFKSSNNVPLDNLQFNYFSNSLPGYIPNSNGNDNFEEGFNNCFIFPNNNNILPNNSNNYLINSFNKYTHDYITSSGNINYNSFSQNHNKANDTISMNHVNQNRVNIPDYIKLYTFNKNYFDQLNNVNENEKKSRDVFIKRISQISQEYEDKFDILYENNIFKIGDLIKIESIGKIYRNTVDVMNGAKNNLIIKQFFPDNIITRFKTFVKNSNKDAINSFDEIKYNISSLKTGDKILENIGKSFNLIYLEQPLYSVLSNESNENEINSNYKKIEEIINKYNQNKQITPLIEYLCLTVKESIDILTYKKEDKYDKYKIKIFDYAAKEYEKFKIDKKKAQEFGEDLEFLKKDYIASLILLAYNFEEYFTRKKGRATSKK